MVSFTFNCLKCRPRQAIIIRYTVIDFKRYHRYSAHISIGFVYFRLDFRRSLIFVGGRSWPSVSRKQFTLLDFTE